MVRQALPLAARDRRLRREVVRVATEMRVRGLTVATCGNVSARKRRGMLITPARVEPTRCARAASWR